MKKLLTLLALIMVLISCNESELQTQTEEIYFYNWDMTNLNTLIINNPIESNRIVDYKVVIYNDFDMYLIYPYCLSSDELSAVKIDQRKITIDITEGGFFDSEKFNSKSQARGYIKIEYY